MNSIVLKIKKRESPMYDWLYRTIKSLRKISVPSIKLVHLPLYYIHLTVQKTLNTLYAMIWTVPIFKARCSYCGNGLRLPTGLPEIEGLNLILEVGNDVVLHRGYLSTSNVLVNPKIKIGNNVHVGRNFVISASQSVEIGDNTLISWDCFISDSDGHSINPTRRAQHQPMELNSIRPVKIGNNVWIGSGCTILKGVSIGDNTIIGANNVITKNVDSNMIVPPTNARGMKLACISDIVLGE